MKRRTVYFIAFALTIALGLLSRKIHFIPADIGDILYAVMAYWLFRSLFYSKSSTFALIASLLFCFTIEGLQLIQYPFFLWIRGNQFLKLIFGQGFLWSDILAYTIGSSTAYFVDRYFIKKN